MLTQGLESAAKANKAASEQLAALQRDLAAVAADAARRAAAGDDHAAALSAGLTAAIQEQAQGLAGRVDVLHQELAALTANFQEAQVQDMGSMRGENFLMACRRGIRWGVGVGTNMDQSQEGEHSPK